MFKKSFLAGLAVVGFALSSMLLAAPHGNGGNHGGGGTHGGGGHTGGGQPNYPQPQPSYPQPNNAPKSVYCQTMNQSGQSFVATYYGQLPEAYSQACNLAMQMCTSNPANYNCHVTAQW